MGRSILITSLLFFANKDVISSFYLNLSTSSKLPPKIFECASVSLLDTTLKCNHPPSKIFFCLEMSPLTRNKIISFILIFMGRVLGKIRRLILKHFSFPLLVKFS
ncbi:hypothetical protein CR513_22333, partial [Mucuna pruriens]